MTTTEIDDGKTSTRIEDVNRVSASLTQRLYDFGATRERTNAARERVSVASIELTQTELDIVAEIRGNFIGTVLAERLVELRRRTVSDRVELRSKIEILTRAGVRPRSDLVRTDIDLKTAEIDLRSATMELQIARTQLREATGLAKIPEGDFDDILKRLPETPEIESAAMAAPAARPEYRSLLGQREATSADLRAAKKDNLPVVSATGSFLSRDRDIDRLGQPGKGDWSAGVSIGWSDYNWTTKGAAVDASVAELRQLSASIEDLERNIRNEVIRSGQSLLEALGRVGGAEELVTASEENLRMIRGRYDAGAATILDIADAQARLTEAEANVLRARADAWTARVRFDRSVAHRAGERRSARG